MKNEKQELLEKEHKQKQSKCPVRVGTQRGAVECRQEMGSYCTCSVPERPHCTAGQNQPKLDSRAKECHCLPSQWLLFLWDYARLVLGFHDFQTEGFWRARSRLTAAASCLVPGTCGNSQRVWCIELQRIWLLLVGNAPTSLPQFPICKMGTVKVPPSQDHSVLTYNIYMTYNTLSGPIVCSITDGCCY